MLQVVEHACELAETSFGNYVIQSCLALCSDKDRYASCAPSHARLISLLLFMSSFILRGVGWHHENKLASCVS